MATNPAKPKQKGEISVTTEHIFPIIKRWLYSDKEIFLREIVSNASDAIVKLQRLISLAQTDVTETDFRIDVVLDKEAGTLSVSDNGIGMSAQEIDRYINQIALSGALEFIEQYEGESPGGIIGHFGLGFYSAFMVSDRVEIETKSYTDAPAVLWSCDEAGKFTAKPSERSARGTTVTLHLSEDERGYLEKATVLRILQKYCGFLATPIYLSVSGEAPAKGEEEAPVNDTDPLWQRKPQDCKPEEYTAFYHKLFGYDTEPLFYVHINADYPLNFKGILYFPRLKNEFQSMEGEVKLYYNRVFVADNISEVVPEYLLSLKGVLDCPELPLNVSRSFLQSSPYVSKVSAHIQKKVCDKICSLYETERETYEGFCRDLKPFLEYGSMKDEKFFSRVRAAILYPTAKGGYLSVEEYPKGSADKTVYYTTDPARQASYIALLQEQSHEVLVFDSLLDTQFISFLEQRDKDLHFVRVDSDLSALKDEGEAQEDEALRKLFSAVLPDKTQLCFARLKNQKTPAVLTSSEQARRLADLMKLYRLQGGEDALPQPENEETLTLNLACPAMEKLAAVPDEARRKQLAAQVYYTALIAARSPSQEELSAFQENNLALLEALS